MQTGGVGFQLVPHLKEADIGPNRLTTWLSSKVELLFEHLKKSIQQVPKKEILAVIGNFNA